MKLIEIDIVFNEFTKSYIQAYIEKNHLFKCKSTRDGRSYLMVDYNIPSTFRYSVPDTDRYQGTIFIEAETVEYNEGEILEDAVLDILEKKVKHTRSIRPDDYTSVPHLVCNLILPDKVVFDEFLVYKGKKYLHGDKLKVRIEVLYRIDNMPWYEGEAFIEESQN